MMFVNDRPEAFWFNSRGESYRSERKGENKCYVTGDDVREI